MKKLIGDMHTHTIASGHAYGTVREMIAAAQEIKLPLLGITEHGPGIPGTCHPMYFGNSRSIPRDWGCTQLLIGAELNVFNDEREPLIYNSYRYLDYAIIGIHNLCYENEGVQKNTDHLIHYMQMDKVKIVSHPDDDMMPVDYDRLAQAGVQYGVALELNNSSLLKPDWRIGCYENYKKMLAACMKYRCPIMIDTDAHDPSAVGDFSKAVEYLAGCEFDEDLIVNNDMEKLLAFLK